MSSSEFSGFYKLSAEDRRKKVREYAELSEDEENALKEAGELFSGAIAGMVENQIGAMPVPLGVATGFLINKKDYLVPMATEEPSVIAAASNAAKLARACGGFVTSSTEPVMIGQIQLLGIDEPEGAVKSILREKKDLIGLANKQDEMLISRGGGARDIEVRVLETSEGKMLIVHLLVDVRDAMGANVINTMTEVMTPKIEEISGGKACLRIISNLAVHRLARAKVVLKKDVVGTEVVDGVVNAYAFAASDPYRCATHNKGIMNGVDAVALATGNDTRALEAGAHAYAAMKGYKPLAHWKKDEHGDLRGEIELPIAAGTVGGAIRTHPVAKIAIKILRVKSARELSEVMAAVGLAQNFAALRALSTEGIQKGHMKLHARNIAILAGAEGKEIDTVTGRLRVEGKISVDRAKEIVKEVRGNK
ncbi:MAG: hydroxymethylglutaryl-CoA reductase, degradative [Candidatus Micrarchaeota archaeon]